MTDFEAKPSGFTAVNGKAASPHTSQHEYRPSTNIDELNRNLSGSNGEGVHSRANSASRSDHHPPLRYDERQAPTSAGPTPRPPSSPKVDAPQDARGTSADRSPSNKKRTYPEAFEDPNVQNYAARPPPARDHPDYRSPDRYHDGGHAHQSNQSHPDRDRSDYAGSPYSNDASQDETERRLTAALKGDSMAHDPVRDAYENQDDGGTQGGYPSQSEYGGTPTRTAAGVAMNHDRKRKRVFSNRTKTGCLTCRKRKKKCDELHPECNNCIRGGFVCEGYSSRTNWQRPTPQTNKAPVPLQSKITGGTYGGTPYHARPSQYPEPAPEPIRGPELRPDERTREPGLGSLNPRDPGGPPPPYPPRLDNRFMNPIAPRYELEPPPRAQEPSGEAPPHEQPMYSQGPPPPGPGPAYSAHQPPVHATSGPPPTAPMHSAPTIAQAALQQVPTALPPASSLTASPSVQALVRRIGEPSERDKMLQGEYYLPYTPVLMADRDQCAGALYRFNQACQNPALGFSHTDRERLFRDLVSVRPTPDQPISASPNTNGGAVEESNARPGGVVPQGSVGPGCKVEAPFHCDYGYNLNIGADVVIGTNCKFIDTCNISIGNGVVMSPGVTLMCATYAIDPKERRKGKGRALGRGIVIEEEAWIGTNVTILPGVRVGRHATVGAGSLIHKDVPPYTVMAGNPPKVVRGIGSDEPRNL